ncbi:MAG: CpsD/CapB family tyrosine-protein kinase [Tateyamaria sp.]|uniref:CpsD/CapB family tyrosine-protein kinase n=1 Tax=Rhodobacterales TaxID=204455 RepID=UPI0032892649
MEKIQSAIAKARAQRGGQTEVSTQHQPLPEQMTEPAAHPNAHDSDAAWDALPTADVSLRRLRTQRIVTLDRNREATEFDKLRTRMLQQMQANNWRRVAITSPGPSSGKSTIVLNLGFSLSRQSRSRTLILEADLRRPSLRKICGLKTDRDFVEVVNGNAPFADHGLRVRPNLSIGAAQSPVMMPAELLQDPKLGAILNDIEATYDPTVMMFDMPPFQVGDDMMAFADKVDCVMIVAAAEKTKMPELDACEREIANVTNVLGIVLNKCRYETSETSYEYYG